MYIYIHMYTHGDLLTPFERVIFAKQCIIIHSFVREDMFHRYYMHSDVWNLKPHNSVFLPCALTHVCVNRDKRSFIQFDAIFSVSSYILSSKSIMFFIVLCLYSDRWIFTNKIATSLECCSGIYVKLMSIWEIISVRAFLWTK